MVDITDEVFESRLVILQNAFTNDLSTQVAAEKLAAVSLSDDTTVEGCVGQLWAIITGLAYNFPEHQDKLAEILVSISRLPGAKTDQGEPLILHKQYVWKDLPILGWQFRDDWNTSIPSKPSDHRLEAISHSVNRNKFVACLMATEEPVLNYHWFALITFRDALETPPNHLPFGFPLEASISAAAAWIEILGVELFSWDKNFSQGPLVGAPGRGGPLWKGKHGFCYEKWSLWRSRFGVLAEMERELSNDVRTIALEAEQMMKEIENGNIE
ncbi:hypothetical protein BDV97DRAFT_371710 [Delphinella strobiligena]|nr:hypothetical protein BDV97DRAFT_371710 [Delphinella strobiligena]